MKKVAVIHQPDFLPYLGFFDRLLKSDLYVVLDNVQFVTGSKESWQKRDLIKTPQGAKWIGLSVQKCALDTRICEVLLSETIPWRQNNMNQIRENYRKAPYFNEIFPYIEQLYRFYATKLMDFNIHSIEILMELLDIKIDAVFAGTLEPQGKSNELVVDILKKVDATTYLSGVGARNYFDPAPYEEAGIEVIWQDFKHPVYPQLYGEFIPYLSSIDLLFNCGIAKSREVIRSV